jgi:predicted permease
MVLLRVEWVAATVIVLQTAVPSAVCTTALVEQYGGDGSLASAGVVTTTLLSLLTLPLWSTAMMGRP